MNNKQTLLPSGASRLARQAAEICAAAESINFDYSDLWNAGKCPEALLPFLAWALSVDYWEERWSEAQKRMAIKAAFASHRQKGTIVAPKRIIEPFGFLTELKEWFQTHPQGVAGTFSLTIEVSETGLNEQTYNELVRLINDVKPVSRHLTSLAIAVSPAGTLNFFIGQNAGEIISVYPC